MLPAEAHRAPGSPLVAARSLTLTLVAGLALIAGCGDGDDDGGSDSANGATEITVTLDPDGPGGDRALTESVTCEAGADGSLPLDPENKIKIYFINFYFIFSFLPEHLA